MAFTTSHTPYIGRFAPSPSGPLHLGSLVTAVGSYLQARSQAGKWLLRIDDIDPPREVAGAATQILHSLEKHGLHWDDDVLFQSHRSHAYDEAIRTLQEAGLTYPCECTRKQSKRLGPYYSGTCRQKKLQLPDCALRFRNQSQTRVLHDQHLGAVQADPLATSEDFIIKRKDGLFAYHLAAVVDDIYQQITEVVRGADLLQPTLCQLALYEAFNAQAPEFIHLPVISSAPGMKLSKQNHARSIDLQRPQDNLFSVLKLLGLNPTDEMREASVTSMVNWAVANWHLANIPHETEIVLV